MYAQIKYLILSLLFFVVGCMANERLIKEGKYIFNKEYLLVSKDKIIFYIKLDKNKKIFIKREYKYSISSDNIIRLFPMRSVDMVFGIGKFNWYSKENKIIRTDFKTKQTIKFIIEGKK